MTLKICYWTLADIPKSIFYFGYLLAKWPQNWALQLYPVAKWFVLNLVIWAGLIYLHTACSNFAGLFVV